MRWRTQWGVACSFDEDTPVATDKGDVPIRDVAVGDRVLAWHEEMGATGYYTVTAVWGHEDPVTVQLVINGETIDTTPEHPFLTANGNWVAAGELQVGDKVRNATGENGLVEAVEFAATPQVMYNMTVADAHTYTVGDGEWVVHNHCGQFHSKILRENIEKYTGFTIPSGVAAHHLIPDSLASHEFVRLAESAGWNNDEWYNGILLRVDQHSFHPHYNNYVASKLDQLWEYAQKYKLDGIDAYEYLDQFVMELGWVIENKLPPGTRIP